MKQRNALRPLLLVIITFIAVGILFYFVKEKGSFDFTGCVRNCLYQNSEISAEQRVDDLLKRMTLEEKIGQMALVEKNSIHDLDDVWRYGIGGILSGGGGKPPSNTPEGWLEMVNNFQSYSQRSRLKIPLLYGADGNHGHSNLIGATIFPHFIGLGATRDSKLVEQIGRITAAEMAATGIFWNFSPNLDIVTDIRWGRVYETFGSDTNLVSNLGEAYVKGAQSVFHDGKYAIATAKHYLGTGAMVWGSSGNPKFIIDQGTSQVDEQELRVKHLPPFKKAIQAGAQVVMVGLNSWNGGKMAANNYLVNEVLKKELGFNGIVVSDWYGVYEISPNKYESTIAAINAGIDMVMIPYEYKNFTEDLKKAVERGRVSEERIDDAVKRILTVKFKMGLFDHVLTNGEASSMVGTLENKKVAREAVRKSVVVLKNENILPIPKNATLAVAGSGAHNLGVQGGGWTVEWQGIDGNWIPGTTILQGILNSVSKKENVIFEEKGNFRAGTLADVGVAVVGEKPYSEGWGDKENPSLSEDDLKTIENLRRYSRKVLIIIISGRPLNIKNHSANWDGILAAWLPGTEGEGVADVLFGDFPFTGKLPLKWEIE